MNKFFHKYTTLNSLFYYICIRNRDVAQLVARHVRDVEAAGSSPVISTANAPFGAFFVTYRL